MKTILNTNFLRNALYLAFMALVTISFTACNEDNETQPQTETEFSADEEVVDGYFEDTDDIVFEINEDLNEFGNGRIANRDRSLSLCAEITHDSDAKTIVIDFGDGCEGPGGKIRSGKILITYTDRKFVSGSVWTYTLEDYVVNGIALEGTKTITNISSSDEGMIRFNKVLSEGKATWPDGSFSTREVNKTITWLLGDLPAEDEFHVEGTASGISKSGNSYSMEILETLIYKRSCRREGIHVAVDGIKLMVKNDEEVSIDYGDGECDAIVTITRGEISTEVDLTDRKRFRNN